MFVTTLEGNFVKNPNRVKSRIEWMEVEECFN